MESDHCCGAFYAFVFWGRLVSPYFLNSAAYVYAKANLLQYLVAKDLPGTNYFSLIAPGITKTYPQCKGGGCNVTILASVTPPSPSSPDAQIVGGKYISLRVPAQFAFQVRPVAIEPSPMFTLGPS